ncbi:pleckstrin homology domain-containing family G member 3-like [Aplochiton taeniatus]
MAPNPNLTYVDRVVMEILETERMYVRDLRSIVEDYLAHIIDMTTLPIGPEQVCALFGNIEDIYEFNSELLQALDQCDQDPVAVARCFVDKSEYFEIYTQYCTNYPNSVRALTDCMRNKTLEKFFRERQAALRCSLPLGSYLLKPVQRILKYHLLLQEIARHYDPEEQGYEVVQEAIDTMTAVAWYINDMKRRHEHAVRQQEIQSLLINWKGPDLTTYGELVLEGSFPVQRAKNGRTLFLFDRMLLITKKRGEHYVYKTHFSCSTLMLLDSAKDPLLFSVIHFKHPKQPHTVKAKSVEEKRLWAHHIKRLILENHQTIVPQKVTANTNPHPQHCSPPPTLQHADSEGSLLGDQMPSLQPVASVPALGSDQGESQAERPSPEVLIPGEREHPELAGPEEEEEEVTGLADHQVADFASSMLAAISCWHHRATALLSTPFTTVRLLATLGSLVKETQSIVPEKEDQFQYSPVTPPRGAQFQRSTVSPTLRPMSDQFQHSTVSPTFPPMRDQFKHSTVSPTFPPMRDQFQPSVSSPSLPQKQDESQHCDVSTSLPPIKDLFQHCAVSNSLPPQRKQYQHCGNSPTPPSQRDQYQQCTVSPSLSPRQPVAVSPESDIVAGGKEEVQEKEVSEEEMESDCSYLHIEEASVLTTGSEFSEEPEEVQEEEEEEVDVGDKGSCRRRLLPDSALDQFGVIAESFSGRSSVTSEDLIPSPLPHYLASPSPRSPSPQPGSRTSSSPSLGLEHQEDHTRSISPYPDPGLTRAPGSGPGPVPEAERRSTLSKQDRLLIHKIRRYYEHAEHQDAAFSIKRRESLSYIPAGLVRHLSRQLSGQEEALQAGPPVHRKGSSPVRPTSWAVFDLPGLEKNQNQQGAETRRDQQGPDTQRDQPGAETQRDQPGAETQKDQQGVGTQKDQQGVDTQRDQQGAETQRDQHKLHEERPSLQVPLDRQSSLEQERTERHSEARPTPEETASAAPGGEEVFRPSSELLRVWEDMEEEMEDGVEEPRGLQLSREEEAVGLPSLENPPLEQLLAESLREELPAALVRPGSPVQTSRALGRSRPVKVPLPRIISLRSGVEEDQVLQDMEKVKNKVFQLARQYSQRIRSQRPAVKVRARPEYGKRARDQHTPAADLEETQCKANGRPNLTLSLKHYDQVIIHEQSPSLPARDTPSPPAHGATSPATSPHSPLPVFSWPDVQELRSKYIPGAPGIPAPPPVARCSSVPERMLEVCSGGSSGSSDPPPALNQPQVQLQSQPLLPRWSSLDQMPGDQPLDGLQNLDQKPEGMCNVPSQAQPTRQTVIIVERVYRPQSGGEEPEGRDGERENQDWTMVSSAASLPSGKKTQNILVKNLRERFQSLSTST